LRLVRSNGLRDEAEDARHGDKVLIDGTERISVTDSAILAVNGAGIFMFTETNIVAIDGCHGDNFSVANTTVVRRWILGTL
jgi:hypothetical protein